MQKPDFISREGQPESRPTLPSSDALPELSGKQSSISSPNSEGWSRPSTPVRVGIDYPTPDWAKISFQRTVGLIFLLPFAGFLVILLKFVGRYEITRMKDTRAQFKELTRSKQPLLICANHLTCIDSALMIWALGSNFWYLRNFRAFSWNLPAGDFFKKKLSYRIVAYLSKCIYIHRDGTKDHQYGVLDLCRKLLKRGEVVTIFPEGRRSRTGVIELEKLTYGVGKILSTLPECRVLCVYLRADTQKTYSDFPAKGSRFYVELKEIAPKTPHEGREAVSDLTHQIAGTLKAMENEYFESHPRPSC
jgi:hypothetical protein